MLRGLLIVLGMCLAAAAQTPLPAKRSVDGTPLLKARLALEQARSRVVEDRFDDAAESLRNASKALADYQDASPGPHAETAAYVREEIDTYARRIARDHSDAFDHIALWLNRVNQWRPDKHK